MPPCRIDHLAVTAPDLAAGAAWVKKHLGIAPQGGGQHPRMGTHNLLLRLGEHTYLEVIAIDPAAQHPGRARWFGLDALGEDAAPALSAWVARSADIHADAARSPEALGGIEAMSRGTLEWLISIQADGRAPLDGLAPALIQWPTGSHPAERLDDHGLQLEALELLHPDPPRVERLLSAIGVQDERLRITPVPAARSAGLIAHIRSPKGIFRLG